jgi:hypothetical protein
LSTRTYDGSRGPSATVDTIASVGTHTHRRIFNTDPATMSPQDAQKEIATNLPIYAGGGPDAAVAKERVVNIMAAK